jgi:hypothetical protein
VHINLDDPSGKREKGKREEGEEGRREKGEGRREKGEGERARGACAAYPAMLRLYTVRGCQGEVLNGIEAL